jgi:hypothetical protein
MILGDNYVRTHLTKSSQVYIWITKILNETNGNKPNNRLLINTSSFTVIQVILQSNSK